MAEIFHIGFTGTRDGMTEAQRVQVDLLLRDEAFKRYDILPGFVAHHGDCIGADAEFNDLAMGWAHVIEIHPPSDPKARAFCDELWTHREYMEMKTTLPELILHPEKPYHDRNDDIVAASDLLIATPKSTVNRTGGTWYTIRKAWELGVAVRVVGPDGSVTS